nr:MAG TPA: hypothetical protein [Caudoviricetes sp.]
MLQLCSMFPGLYTILLFGFSILQLSSLIFHLFLN